MGYRVKEYREQLGLTQEELAERSGVSRATISMLENAEERVTMTSTLAKLADAMNVSIDNLFYTKDV